MIADKAPDAFRTISEAAEELGLEQHVLRFWETRFSQIKPLKRGGGRRYYRPDDVDFLRGLKHLLHEQRYTIKGVQKIIKEHGVRFVMGAGKDEGAAASAVLAASAPKGARSIRSLEARVEAAAPPRPRPAPVVMPAGASASDRLQAALAELRAAKDVLASL